MSAAFWFGRHLLLADIVYCAIWSIVAVFRYRELSQLVTSQLVLDITSSKMAISPLFEETGVTIAVCQDFLQKVEPVQAP